RFAAPTLSPPTPSSDVIKRMTSGPDARPERFETLDASGEGYDDLYAPIVTVARDADETLSAGPSAAPRREVVGVARVGLSLRPAKDQLQDVVRWGAYLALGL